MKTQCLPHIGESQGRDGPGIRAGPDISDGEPFPYCGGADTLSSSGSSRSSPNRGGGGVLFGLVSLTTEEMMELVT
jgi:hypothetical protein